MNTHRISTEKGQTLVIAVIGFLIFVAMLALVLDGGNAYAGRRQAQNAADAGALAGASYMCKWGDPAGGEAMAIDYAVNRNGAASALADANMASATVVVTATVQRDTFFAGVIGFNEVTPRAVAAAKCEPPAAMGVLPVAWSCRETVVEDVVLPGADCAQVFGPCSDLSCIYTVMDTVKFFKDAPGCGGPNAEDDPTCFTSMQDVQCDALEDDNGNGIIDPAEYSYISPPPVGSSISIIDCDTDDDGINELQAGGDRSWLDLNGPSGGANELKGWLTGGYAPPLDTHTWLPNASGSVGSAFIAVVKDCQDGSATCLVGKDVVLPVFNKYCNTSPTVYDLTFEEETATYCEAGSGDDLDLINNGTNNYHVIAFATFHVTCVQTGKNRAWKEGVGPANGCPGHDSAVNPVGIDDKDKTIEGYFIDEQITGYGGSGQWVNTGTFVVVLIK